MIGPHGSNDRRRELRDLLEEYGRVFGFGNRSLGRTSAVHHSIDTGELPPVKIVLIGFPPRSDKQFTIMSLGLLAQGTVEESYSPWSTSVVLVYRRTESLVALLCQLSPTQQT